MKIYDEFEAWMQNGAPEEKLGDESEYPIAGCREVIARAAKEAIDIEAERVLCVGPGSELIAGELYDEGCDVWIADESLDKLKSLVHEMPKAHFLHCDVFDVMPDLVYTEEFDAVICTYIMHRTSGEERVWAIEDFRSILSPDGRIIIGDICFWTTAEREICRRRCSDSWDADAAYIVYDDFRKLFDDNSIEFYRISHCSGVIVIEDDDYDDD